MKTLKLLWVEDDVNFGPSIHFRVDVQLGQMQIELAKPELLTGGEHVWDTVRDWKPDIIMMDHNLEDVRRNGANLITEIRFHDNETPIIFYSSEMDEDLMKLVAGENNVHTTNRADVAAELMRVISSQFT